MKNEPTDQCKDTDAGGDSKMECEQDTQHGSMEEGTKTIYT